MRRRSTLLNYALLVILLIYTFLVFAIIGPWLFDLHKDLALWVLVPVLASVPAAWLWFLLNWRRPTQQQRVLK